MYLESIEELCNLGRFTEGPGELPGPSLSATVLSRAQHEWEKARSGLPGELSKDSNGGTRKAA